MPWNASVFSDSPGDAEWTEPRDTIYAILGLLDSEGRTLGTIPDYTKATSRIYEDTATRILASRSSLSFLETCELASKSTTNLPSWVPDWSIRMHARCQISPNWNACAWISAQTRVVGGAGRPPWRRPCIVRCGSARLLCHWREESGHERADGKPRKNHKCHQTHHPRGKPTGTLSTWRYLSRRVLPRPAWVH